MFFHGRSIRFERPFLLAAMLVLSSAMRVAGVVQADEPGALRPHRPEAPDAIVSGTIAQARGRALHGDLRACFGRGAPHDEATLHCLEAAVRRGHHPPFAPNTVVRVSFPGVRFAP